MDRAKLLDLARDALEKLYQEPLLEIHPLADIFLAALPIAARGPALKKLLLDLMQQLRPPHIVPYNAPPWRRYECLFEYYLDGTSFEDLAIDHGISERQVRRDYRQAMDTLADLLWAHFRELKETVPTTIAEPGSPLAATHVAEEIALSRETVLETELRRVGARAAPSLTRVGDLLERIVPMVTPLARQGNAQIELVAPASFPVVRADETVLRQALLSLVCYATESCPGGRVIITASDDQRMIAIRGVAPLSNGARREGLGKSERLELSEKLLAMFGAKLQERLDQTGFTIELVLTESDSATLLIVDDNPDVIRLFQRYLSSSDFRLIQATNGEHALRLAREVQPSVITLDLMIPARDGWDLLQALTADEATCRIPIVVCSVVHERALAMALGATAFVPKPVNRTTLIDALVQCQVGSLHRLQSGT